MYTTYVVPKQSSSSVAGRHFLRHCRTKICLPWQCTKSEKYTTRSCVCQKRSVLTTNITKQIQKMGRKCAKLLHHRLLDGSLCQWWWCAEAIQDGTAQGEGHRWGAEGEAEILHLGLKGCESQPLRVEGWQSPTKVLNQFFCHTMVAEATLQLVEVVRNEPLLLVGINFAKRTFMLLLRGGTYFYHAIIRQYKWCNEVLENNTKKCITRGEGEAKERIQGE